MKNPSNSSSTVSLTKLKVAIVHDWLYGGGAEKVVLELHKIFPEAPIYTSYSSDEWRQKLNHQVVTGYLQRWPFANLRKFLVVLRQWWFSQLDLSEYDLVISSSGNGEAKFALSSHQPFRRLVYWLRHRSWDLPRPIHINYCHTPTHFYWRHQDQYLKNPGFRPKWLIRLSLKILVGPLKRRDYRAAQMVDVFIANSTHIQADIDRYYDRDSVVIHPPVDIDRFTQAAQNSKSRRRGFITLARQVPLKKIDLMVAACTKLNLPLTVLGSGPEHDNLKKIAGPSIKFIKNPTDAQVARALAGAEAFLFASYEDFGITPVEALAAGTPVIAYRAGGALDYIVEGQTGQFFEHQTVESLAQALQQFDASLYKKSTLQKSAQRFSAPAFKKRFIAFLDNLLKG